MRLGSLRLMARQSFTGLVMSTKMDKTVKVMVQRYVRHPLYDVYRRRVTKLLCHDEGNMCTVGDEVRIEACRPLSKRKAFTVLEIVQPVEKYVDPETGVVWTNAQIPFTRTISPVDAAKMIEKKAKSFRKTA